ncbi:MULTISPECIES: chromosomal replication initiator DnaA [Roseinatronobacter]|uniref:Chromosomal replication initiator DnaA n=1 Tax=Roseinatronobacter domitianus TaxID=2940293 RepID=A0ABT0LXJ3_9RHOB|nr:MULTISPECIES: chromosomal replication initiator DnaA [Roseibaca]MCL1627330.1 chromosomal replication initiator DnaA [Roseibaca domitiana]
MSPRQSALKLDLPARMGRADFVPSACNAAALGLLGAALPGGRLVLHGPQGSGKTHLGHVWGAARGAQHLMGAQLAGADLPALIAHGAVWLDEAERVADSSEAQTALFHLLNLAQAHGAEVLMAARAPARDWGVTLPDLASRLGACAHVALAAPDDALLAAVLAKLFADRQVVISDRLIPYLLPRMERSLAAAQRLVAQLDTEALARGKPIGRALAAEVMQRA